MKQLTRTIVSLVILYAFVLMTTVTISAAPTPRLKPSTYTKNPTEVVKLQDTLNGSLDSSEKAQTVAPSKKSNNRVLRNHAKQPVKASANGASLKACYLFEEEAKGCWSQCMENNIPPEVWIACALLCGSANAPGCAACLGFYIGIAAYCGTQCGLAAKAEPVRKQSIRSADSLAKKNRASKKRIAAT